MSKTAQTPLPAFSIAMVNYKTLDLTKNSLSFLKRHMDEGLLDSEQVDIWVVDNDSQDESTDYLRSLDWIHLIERKVTEKEKGYVAHGIGLDLILEKIETDYVFLMHTDTFVYDAEVFSLLFNSMKKNENVAGIGCKDQINRGYLRTGWRIVNGFFKYHFRRLKLAIGMQSREPKPYIEPYIKSFFALWNVRLMKEMGLQFLMEDRIPGYALQDILLAKGYKINRFSPMYLFRFLDHAEAGTVGLVSGYSDGNRRLARKKAILDKLANNQTEGK